MTLVKVSGIMAFAGACAGLLVGALDFISRVRQ